MNPRPCGWTEAYFAFLALPAAGQPTTVPAVDVLALLDIAIFNLIAGNADAHGKNFSLLYQAGAVSLAPFYDLLSTVAYPDLSPKLAMRIARKATLEEVEPATQVALGKVIRAMGVKEFAEQIRMASPNVLRAINSKHNPTQVTLNRLLEPFELRLSLAKSDGPQGRHAA